MIYRVTCKNKELEIPNVIKFGEKLQDTLGDSIMPFPLLYQGTLADLYPELSPTEH